MPLHIPVADGMRALAVAIVALYHFWQQSWLSLEFRVGSFFFTLQPIIRSGYMVVDILLLLSGFLLFLPWAKSAIRGTPTPQLREFYGKRAVRVLPSYYFTVLLVLFAFALPGNEYKDSAELWRDLLSHLTMTHTFMRDSYLWTKLNVVLWTLAIEAQAYVVFPFIARLFAKRPQATFACMCLTGLAYRLFICIQFEDMRMWVNQLPAFADVYALGMAAAYVYAYLSCRGERPLSPAPDKNKRYTEILWTLLAAAASIGIWKLMSFQSQNFYGDRINLGQAALRLPMAVCAAVWLVSASQSFRMFQTIFGNRILKFFAGISFQYYIWHQYIAVRLRVNWRFPPYAAPENPQIAGERPWQWQYLLVCVFLNLVVAVVFTYFVERPLARFFGGRGNGRQLPRD